MFGHALLITSRKCSLEAAFAHMKSMWASHFMLEETCIPNSLKEVTLSTAWLSTTSWSGGSFCSGPSTMSFVFLQFNFILLASVHFTKSLTTSIIPLDWPRPRIANNVVSSMNLRVRHCNCKASIRMMKIIVPNGQWYNITLYHCPFGFVDLGHRPKIN